VTLTVVTPCEVLTGTKSRRILAGHETGAVPFVDPGLPVVVRVDLTIDSDLIATGTALGGS
jgi:hypothetical protein